MTLNEVEELRSWIDISRQKLEAGKDGDLTELKKKLSAGVQLHNAMMLRKFWARAVEFAKSPEVKFLNLDLGMMISCYDDVIAGESEEDLVEVYEDKFVKVHECSECGGPVTRGSKYSESLYPEEFYDSHHRHSDIFEILKCSCGGPLLHEVGNLCPECGGLVLKFEHVYCCLHSIIGKCGFILNRYHYDDLSLDPTDSALITLMEEGVYEFESYPDNILYQVRLVRSNDSDWELTRDAYPLSDNGTF